MINLQIIIDGLEMVDDMNRVFFDTETNDTVYLSDSDPSLTADTAELMEANPSRFIPLPTQREINEYGMMRDFVDSLLDGDQKFTLAVAISGRGAFRRFLTTVHHFDLEESWYAFRDKEYARVARRWCEDNDVEYYQKGSGVPLEELLEDIAADEDSDEPVNVVKIDTKGLSRAGVLEGILKGVFGDDSIEVSVDDDEDDDHEHTALTPDQAVKFHGLYKSLSTLQGELEDLAEEVDGELGEALSEAVESVEDALDRLDELKDVAVEIVVDGEPAEKL